jgi:hypothetical protein
MQGMQTDLKDLCNFIIRSGAGMPGVELMHLSDDHNTVLKG